MEHSVAPAGELEEEYEAPISKVIRIGDIVYVAGHVAHNADGSNYAPGDVVRQAERTFELMQESLASVGAELTDIVKLVSYFTDPLTQEVAEAYWDVRKQFFGDRKIASTGIRVAGLNDPDWVIEMDAIAHVGHGATH